MAGAVVLGAGTRVVAGESLVGWDAVAGAAGGVAHLGGAEVLVLQAGHGLRGTRAAALRLYAVVHGTRIVVVADSAADRRVGAAPEDIAVPEVHLHVGRRHLDGLRLGTGRDVTQPRRPAGVRHARERTGQQH